MLLIIKLAAAVTAGLFLHDFLKSIDFLKLGRKASTIAKKQVNRLPGEEDEVSQ